MDPIKAVLVEMRRDSAIEAIETMKASFLDIQSVMPLESFTPEMVLGLFDMAIAAYKEEA